MKELIKINGVKKINGKEFKIIVRKGINNMKKLRSLYYKTKNAIKYSLKRNVTIDELHKCNSLAHGGYMSWRTYAKVVSKEVETRIRNAN